MKPREYGKSISLKNEGHMKHTLGIRDQKGWNQCPEWGPGTKVGVPEKGKIKNNSKAF